MYTYPGAYVNALTVTLTHTKAATPFPEKAYVDALIKDLKNDLALVQNRKLHSIFFGGGTPSLFSATSIETVIRAAQEHIGFEDSIEITLEANPGTAEYKKFADFNAAGVNRLSLGVQSFNDNHLSALGRIHNGDNARNAVKMAQNAGFDRLNIDLMHGLPNQTRVEAIDDLGIAIDMGATHISWYQLTIEPNTAFYSKPPLLPAEDRLADIQDIGYEKLMDAGFDQYEVSAFSLYGEACRHNINYWEFGDYLGIGAGAHGKLTQPYQEQIVRTAKTRMPEHFMRQAGATPPAEKPITIDQLPIEFLMNALRLTSGINKNMFTHRTGLKNDHIARQVIQLQQEGLLVTDESKYCVTTLGMRFLDSVLQRFS